MAVDGCILGAITINVRELRHVTGYFLLKPGNQGGRLPATA